MNQLYQTALQKITGALLLTLLFTSVITASAQTTRYVKEGGTGGGTSWADASGDLQLMINNSSSGDQVWVARGTFKPNRQYGGNSIYSNHQDNTFTLKAGVSVYGSFAGTETNVSERKIEDNPTILSGDFGGNDQEATGGQLYFSNYGRSENAYHVVTAYGYSGTFDGFRIMGGNASGTGVVQNNVNRKYGGGMYIVSSGGIFSNIFIKGSMATSRGGAIYVEKSSTIFVNLNLLWCYAGEGGGVYSYDSSGRISNSIIHGCYAGLNVGGGGAIAVESNYPVLQNCVVYNNDTRGASGSAFLIKAYSGLHVMNCIVHENGFWVQRLTGTNAAITYYNSNVQVNGVNGTSGGGNISADPKFLDPLKFDFRLKPDSPSINTGKNQHSQEATDRAGNPRINGVIDMGAYEYHAVPVRYVKPVASGTGDGSSWTNASDDLQLMINSSYPGEQVWVAKGTYKPKRTPSILGSATSDNRSNTFLLRTGVAVYGSFAGNETSINGRDFTGNATILSGDFNNDDINVTADKLSNAASSKNGENALHVVSGLIEDNIVFDGFTIKGGNANITQSMVFVTFHSEGFLGGGIYLESLTNSTFKNIVFENCHAVNSAGAFYISYSNSLVSGIKIDKCSSTYGVLSNYYGTPVYSNILISNCYGISSSAIAGVHDKNEPLVMTNITIANNQAAANGATIRTDGSQIFDIRNSIFFGNTGDKFYLPANTSSLKFTNSLIEGSGGSQAWNIGFGTNAGNNVDADPLFTNAANGDYTLQAGSPAINAGNNSFVTSIPTDIAGNARIHDNVADMGAYEYSGTSCAPPAAPVASSQAICPGATVADLIATGTNLKWYGQAEGGNALGTDDELTAGTYYVSQSNGTCESTRTAVAVTLSANCTKLVSASCGATLSFTSLVYAAAVPGATMYRFKIVDNNNETQTIERASRSFRMNELSSPTTYGASYTVQVAVRVNGQWSGYGEKCTVSNPSLSQPRLKEVHCSMPAASLTSMVYAETVSFAQGYRFRITEAGQTPQVIEGVSRSFKISQITGNDYNKSYTVEVAVKVADSWSAYGPSCTVNLPASPISRLKDAHCNGTVNSLTAKIYAVKVNRATGYRFRITNGGNVQEITRTANMFQLNMLAAPAFHVTYTVEVSVQTAGAWGEYGPACTVTAIWPGGLSSRPGEYAVTTDAEMAGEEQAENEILSQAVTLSAYPNPYADAFTVEMDTQSTEKITVRAFDMNGRLVEDITIAAEELATQKLGSRLMPGVYNVIVLQGDYQKSFRIIKK